MTDLSEEFLEALRRGHPYRQRAGSDSRWNGGSEHAGAAVGCYERRH